ncbi:hypothetical protein SAMN05660206_11615 [Sphingobacterium wenxiniae]|uniref:Uncharacterized protein n=1 Tax=Sphingobacterium wenxiniae TaxID=683125 RepID=A0A1I6VPQ5_9SPHI|nr:hypothetical protein SAMN05660206_11615 [Sphingobacterium wenxiniae]
MYHLHNEFINNLFPKNLTTYAYKIIAGFVFTQSFANFIQANKCIEQNGLRLWHKHRVNIINI